MSRLFHNRHLAGRALAYALKKYSNREDTLVLALPRGGLPLADEVAKSLSLPIDLWLVRKLGIPGHDEVAMGALTLGGVCYLDTGIIGTLNISKEDIDKVIARETAELARQDSFYRRKMPAPSVAGKTVIVIDDGVATGATMHAALLALHKAQASYIVVAIPVGPQSACDKLQLLANEVVCLHKPDDFHTVSSYYEDFSQVSDTDVLKIWQRQHDKQ